MPADVSTFCFTNAACNVLQHLGAAHRVYMHCDQALRDREEAVRNGKLTTIVFIRDFNSRKQEVGQQQ